MIISIFGLKKKMKNLRKILEVQKNQSKKLTAVRVSLDSALLKQKRLANYFNYDFPYEDELKKKRKEKHNDEARWILNLILFTKLNFIK